MSRLAVGLVVATLTTTFTFAVSAEPSPETTMGPALPAAVVVQPDAIDSVKTKKKRRFYFRAGVTHVMPLEMSRELELADVDGPASLAVENGPIDGSGSSVSSATVPAAVVGYVLPWLDGKLSIETVLAPPFTVKFKATGTLAEESIAPEALGIPTGVPALGEELGEAKGAPPVVTIVYALDDLGPIKPFAGAGLSVLIAYDAKITNPILTEVGEPEFDVDPAPGIVLQGGAEAKIWRSVYARLDIKFVALMLARARVTNIEVATPELPLFETAAVGTAKMDVWVNPLVISFGAGMDF